jgi:hypothetical protein
MLKAQKDQMVMLDGCEMSGRRNIFHHQQLHHAA